MKIVNLLLLLVLINALSLTDFEKAMTSLKNLEKYIKNYIKEKENTNSLSLTHLITCYIRLGAYTGTEWSIVGGSIPNDLEQYIKDKDSTEGTDAQSCQKYREIDLPNNEKIDFVHFFAVINGIENGNSCSSDSAHLVGWGGDTFQLLQDIKNEKGSLTELMDIAKNYFMIKGGFGPADVVSDLDAPIIFKKKNDNNDFADIIKDYYNSKEYLNRINNFVELTFPSIKRKEDFREQIFKIYSSDSFIKILECKDGIRSGVLNCLIPGEINSQYIDHQKAAVNVVSDYLSEKYEPESETDPEPEEEKESEKEEEHVEEGPEPDNKDNTDNSGIFFKRLSLFYLLYLLC